MKTDDMPLSLKIFPDAVLREVCEPVEKFDAAFREIISEMFALMSHAQGVGLAAPQAGISQQFFVCGIKNETLALVNPALVEVGREAKMIEGCLSLPGVHVSIRRNERIYVAGLNVHGKRMQYELTGLWARIVQHEMDHLRGILICDHGENVLIEEAKEDKREYDDL